jgi:hypothetical protein
MGHAAGHLITHPWSFPDLGTKPPQQTRATRPAVTVTPSFRIVVNWLVAKYFLEIVLKISGDPLALADLWRPESPREPQSPRQPLVEGV